MVNYIEEHIKKSFRNIFNKFKMSKEFSFENDFMIKYINSLKLSGFLTDTYFIDIGIPKDYKTAQSELPEYWGNKQIE